MSLLSEVPPRVNLFLKIDESGNTKENLTPNNNSKNNKNDKQYWASGTGYGYTGLAEWDIESTNKAKEEREKQLMKCIRNITKRLTKIISYNLNVMVVDIIEKFMFCTLS